ncbi:MAG: hypothetical protein LBR21_06950 [Propionibacteriaceae bacterium]|jgi:hypothetical protein|nr:hypothetical protein [Propionibacteriaceae bacterium]
MFAATRVRTRKVTGMVLALALGVGLLVAPAPAKAVALSDNVTKYGKTIISVAKAMDFGDDAKHAAVVAFMTVYQESDFRNYANDGVYTAALDGTSTTWYERPRDWWLEQVKYSMTLPHDYVGSDHDSVGLFQHRPATEWDAWPYAATLAHYYPELAIKRLMDPAWCAQIFFTHLKAVSGWQSMEYWKAAASVQHPAKQYETYYEKHKTKAVAAVEALWNTVGTAKLLPNTYTGSGPRWGALKSAQNVYSGSYTQSPVVETLAKSTPVRVYCYTLVDGVYWDRLSNTQERWVLDQEVNIGGHPNLFVDECTPIIKTAQFTPKISGTAKVGNTLTAKGAPSGWTIKYRWLRNGKSIKGATKAKYTPTYADAGQQLSVKVTATKKNMTKTVITSAMKYVSKLSTKVKVSAPKTISKNTKAVLRITVKITGNSKPAGKLLISYGSKTKTYKLKASKKGVFSYKLPKLAKGKQTITVQWVGDSHTKRKTKTFKIKVR